MSEELKKEKLEKVEDEVVENNYDDYDDDYTTPTYEETGKKGNGAAEFVVAGLAIYGGVKLAEAGIKGGKWIFNKGKEIYGNIKSKSEETKKVEGEVVTIEEAKESNSKKTK